MDIRISNYAFGEFRTQEMENLSLDLGIEVFLEYGTQYYWNSLLPVLMEGRTGGISAHGPFVSHDLSDCEVDEEQLKNCWNLTFEICQKNKIRQCVCHPYGRKHTKDEPVNNRIKAQKCSIERVLMLSEIAEQYGVELLVENLPEKNGLMNEEEFLSCFEPHKGISFLMDTGHANLQEWNIDYAFKTLGKRLKAFHINDNLGDVDSHLMIREGNFDWNNFLDNYRKYTPDATLVLEYSRRSLEDIQASVKILKNMLESNE